ncbi:hypothetical protein RRF57_009320 [Xylaria bambusicola]|uniref:Uncharacterized protein n=1 Tax=Xylaria bambusicola TaxID=326684 RepID=A0AAN7ZBW8_9PEZI
MSPTLALAYYENSSNGRRTGRDQASWTIGPQRCQNWDDLSSHYDHDVSHGGRGVSWIASLEAQIRQIHALSRWYHAGY